MKTIVAAATAAMIAIGAAGCSPNVGPNEAGGTILGAVAGGLLGSRFGGGAGKVAATMAGTMLGGILGSKIGQNMDEAARAQAYNAQYAAINSGAPTQWRAPNGAYGTVEPLPVYADANGTCRKYKHTIYIEGRPQTGFGTACRNAYGSWDIVN